MFFPPFFLTLLRRLSDVLDFKKTTTKNRKVKGETPLEEASRQIHKTVF